MNTLHRSLLLSVLCGMSFLLTGTNALAATVAALNSAGDIYTADASNVSGSKSLVTTLSTGSGAYSYIDVTYGDGTLYALRSDGSVYTYNLSTGATSTYATTGWSSSITKIDYANGALYGMTSSSTSGSKYTYVYNSSGTLCLNLGSYYSLDFGVTSTGNIAILGGTSGAPYAYVFAQSSSSVSTASYLYFSNFAFGTSAQALSLEVNGTEVVGLEYNTNGDYTRYINATGSTPANITALTGLTSGLTTGLVSLALTDDNSSVYLMGSDLSLYSSTGALLGDLGDGTGIGLVVIVPEPGTVVTLVMGLLFLVVYRRRSHTLELA